MEPTMPRRTTQAMLAASLLALTVACQPASVPPAQITQAADPTLPAHCHLRSENGQPLPDPACTPGALNPNVTQANIGATICQGGWASSVRPPESYTEPLKRKGITAYGFSDTRLSDYEFDHRVPLSSGGNPRSTLNLWPQGYERTHVAPAGFGSENKDKIEDYVNRLICSGKLSLSQGQAVFLGNWWTWRQNNMPRSAW